MKGNHHNIYRILKVCILLTILWSNPAIGEDQMSMPGQGKVTVRNNGEMVLWLVEKNQDHRLGALAYDQNLTPKQIDISRENLSGKVRLAITHKGPSSAHIDAVFIDNTGPVSVEGSREDKALALKKLARINNDLIDADNRRLEFEFNMEKPAEKVKLAARIEPEQLIEYPFTFPLDNLYSPISPASVFYEYTVNSQTGKTGTDHITDNVKPFFKVFSKAGSGHPSEFTYGWVSNDRENLYVTIDFSGDNTMDVNGKDYAKVHINTKEGLKTFLLTQEKQKWGLSKFIYTASNAYQHRVYEFVIPFLTLGADLTKKLKIAVEAYGTLAPPPPPLPVYLPDHIDPIDPDTLIDPEDPENSQRTDPVSQGSKD